MKHIVRKWNAIGCLLKMKAFSNVNYISIRSISRAIKTCCHGS